MPLSLALVEPKTAEYLYIDSHNRVHLLLPIVGGESIGIDNTCKTVMEMQAFFYGKGDKSAKDRKPSALEVLSDYASKLKADIAYLAAAGKHSQLLALKQQRLNQVDGYSKILTKLKDNFDKLVQKDAAFPEFPQEIQAMLTKQSNCLSVHLSPEHPDNFLQTESPVFSLTRPKVVIHRDGYYVPQPVDKYAGLGPSLRKSLRALGESRSNVKTEIIAEMVAYYQDKEKPSLVELQGYMTRVLKEKFPAEFANVNLTQDNSGHAINEEYFEMILGEPYEEWTMEEAIPSIFSAALDDSVWSNLKQASFFQPDEKLSEQERVEKLAMAAEFFLASINIYCKAKGLSSKNFGPEMDKNAEQIAERVKTAISNGTAEEELFKIINELQTPLGLLRPLNAEDKAKIKQTFDVQYSTIKDSPHLDEFIFFQEDVKGDFFNHKNRISLPFLDLVTLYLPKLGADKRSAIIDLIVGHSLFNHVRDLKEQPLRSLQANNPTPSSTFVSFIESINDHTITSCATYLCSQINKVSDLTTQLSFNELDVLLNHPKWPAMEKAMRNHPEEGKRQLASQAIDYAKNHLQMVHAKLLTPQKGEDNKGAIANQANWSVAIKNLEECINSYKGRLLYRFKSNERKTQVNELEVLLLNLKKEGLSPEMQMQTLNRTLMSLDTIIAKFKPEKNSTFQEKVTAVRALFIATFNLQETAIGKKPDAAEEALNEHQKSKLGSLVDDYKCLHHLNSSWMTAEGVSVLKRLPASYHNYEHVGFFNTTKPEQWDQFVLKAIDTDKLAFSKSMDLNALSSRGQFISNLEARNLSKEVHDAFLKLANQWWNTRALDSLVALNLKSCPDKVQAFLNTVFPEQLDDLAVRGLNHQIQTNQLHNLTLDSLRCVGNKCKLLGDLSSSNPILHSLKTEWWASESSIAAVKRLGKECFTEKVIDFLNAIKPVQLNEQLIRGLQKANKTGAINYSAVYALGRNEASTPARQATVEHEAPTPSSAKQSFFAQQDWLTDKLEQAKQRYAAHTKNKWFDIGNKREVKNEIIQANLGDAITRFKAGEIDVGMVRDIVESTKEYLESNAGSTWSWFKCFVSVPESSKVLDKLIQEINHELGHEAEEVRALRV